MTAAVIQEGVVTNVIVVAEGYTGPHVVVGDRPVAIGDTYDGAEFWRDGERVIGTAEREAAELAALQAELEDARAALSLLGVEQTDDGTGTDSGTDTGAADDAGGDTGTDTGMDDAGAEA